MFIFLFMSFFSLHFVRYRIYCSLVHSTLWCVCFARQMLFIVSCLNWVVFFFIFCVQNQNLRVTHIRQLYINSVVLFIHCLSKWPLELCLVNWNWKCRLGFVVTLSCDDTLPKCYQPNLSIVLLFSFSANFPIQLKFEAQMRRRMRYNPCNRCGSMTLNAECYVHRFMAVCISRAHVLDFKTCSNSRYCTIVVYKQTHFLCIWCFIQIRFSLSAAQGMQRCNIFFESNVLLVKTEMHFSFEPFVGRSSFERSVTWVLIGATRWCQTVSSRPAFVAWISTQGQSQLWLE